MGGNKIGILYLELARRIIDKTDCYGYVNKEEINFILGYVFHIAKPKRPLIIKELELSNFISPENNSKKPRRYKVNGIVPIKNKSDNISKLYHSVGMY